MRFPHPPSTNGRLLRIHDRSGGFVLVATLSLLALAVATLIAFTLLLGSQSELSEVDGQMAAAKRNALNALDLAIGELQLHTGVDQVSTCPAGVLLDGNPTTPEFEGVEHPYWTYSTDSGGTWLVSSSGTPNPDGSIPATDAVKMLGQGTLGAGMTPYHVEVEKVPVQSDRLLDFPSGTTTGYYAYWIGEENTKANVSVWNALETTPTSAFEQASLALATPLATSLKVLFPDQADSIESQDRSKWLFPQQLFSSIQSMEQIGAQYPFLTTFSKGVLSNSEEGGLKINLSDDRYRDALITDEMAQVLRPEYHAVDHRNSIVLEDFQIHANHEDRSADVASTYNTDDVIDIVSPVLTEFRLSMGIFHTQSDSLHRVRYHIYQEWLNPYPYDMGFNYPRGWVVIVDNLPRIRLTNVSSGQGFTADLDDFDENLSSNTNNESKVNSWQEFDQLSNSSGTLEYGIDPGRVYRMSEQSATDQPRGLARTIEEGSSVEWQYQSSLPPGGARAPNTIYGNDTIRIESIDGGDLSIDVRLIPIFDHQNSTSRWAPMIPTHTTPDQFASSNGYVLRLRNIPFDPIHFTLSGRDYSRRTSSSFSPGDYRIAFHFRLLDDTTSLETLANLQAFRGADVDFSNAAIRNLYEISRDTRNAAASGVGFSDLDLFWDSEERENNPPANEEFVFQLFDLPIMEPTSNQVFTMLNLGDRPTPWIGQPDAGDFNRVFDRYCFSGNLADPKMDAEVIPWTDTVVPGGVFQNSRLLPLPDDDGQFPAESTITASNGTAHVLLNGAFNLHSNSVKAWTTLLKNQVPNPDQGPWDVINVSGDEIPNVISRMPNGAPGIEDQLTDRAFEGISDQREERYRQGIRALDHSADEDLWIESLAEEIINGIRQWVNANGRPFRSIRELANEAIIEEAIEDVQISGRGLNEDIPFLASGYLKQADILGMLDPLLTVRSDTFTIRTFGESVDPRTRNSRAIAYAEAVVQRLPELVDDSQPADTNPTSWNMKNTTFGRRYQVVSFRWLQPHEI